MKNCLFLAMTLILAHSALAEITIPWTKEGCESVKGTWITAHSPTDEGCDAAHCNGKTFCRSNVAMTWFNALIWCQSIGHKLVSFEHLCPGITITGPCTNIKNLGGDRYAWTNMIYSTNQAVYVYFPKGTAGFGGRSTDYNATYAVCEE